MNAPPTIRVVVCGDQIVERVFLGFETTRDGDRVIIMTHEEYILARRKRRAPEALSFRVSDIVDWVQPGEEASLEASGSANKSSAGKTHSAK